MDKQGFLPVLREHAQEEGGYALDGAVTACLCLLYPARSKAQRPRIVARQ